jgi:2-hydroxychromene-2-carboxylate isomerase
MKPAELFGVFVRALGLLVVLYGVYELWAGLDNVAENLIATTQGDSSDQPASLGFFVFGLPSLVLGAVVFFGAERIVRLAYRHPAA